MRLSEFRVADQIDKVGGLLREHWEELATNKRLMVLAPALDLYERMDASGACLAIGAFDGDEMFGYSVCFIGPHPHYAGLTVAQNDVLFVAKARRNGPAGMRLIRETERMAAVRGARLLVWHAKQGTALEALMPRLGYGVQDILFSKALTPPSWHSDSAQPLGRPSEAAPQRQ